MSELRLFWIDGSSPGSADTVAALLTLCRKGPKSGAKAAPRAILAVEGQSLACQHLAALAEELVGRLGKTGAASDPDLAVNLAALSSIGRLLPEASPVLVFQHLVVCISALCKPMITAKPEAASTFAVQVFSELAGQVARFVLGPLLRSTASVNGKRSATKASRGWSNPAPHVRLKAFGIKVSAGL